MIYVDTRAGSGPLVEPLRTRGLEVEDTILPSADIAWTGKGNGGEPVDVGIEFKKLGELIQSIRDGRLAGDQLPEMGSYRYRWLLIEGVWTADEKGRMVTPRWRNYRGRKYQEWEPPPGGFSAVEFEKHLFTYLFCAGCWHWATIDRHDTLRWIEAQYRWWTDRALDEHTSHLAVHTPANLAPINPWRRAFCAWPGIGLRTSMAVDREFEHSVQVAANAPLKQWAQITTNDKGRRFGEAAAAKLVRFLKGQE